MDVPDIDNKSNLSDDDQDPKALSSTSSQNHLEDPEADQNPSQLQSDSLSNSQKLKKDAKAKKPKPKVILNVSDCRYEVVRYVGRKMLGYKVTKDMETEWDVFWTDQAVQPETLARMQTFQKINHFPGMYSLARKNHLGRNLMRMKKAFPQHYKFFPQTYLLPAEYSEFKSQFASKGTKTFIVKPEASCQGRGIFLTRNADSIQPGEHYVVQRYLQKPFLLDNLKFDIRLYVLVAGCDPLRLYLYHDGLARFATEEYVVPSGANIDNMCMHLTNYAINKDNPNFVFNESAEKTDVGHKRSLVSVMKVLEERGHDVKGLWKDIKNIIIKTFCGVQPILAHNYKSCQPDEPNNNMCFEVLGLDIILDHKLKPWLLEVNHTPSFTTDTPFDKTIKRAVISDALKLMNVSANHKIRYKNKKKAELQQRVLTGKKIKATPEERQAACQKAQQERDAYENKHLGGYEKVYPFDDPSEQEEPYEEFIKVAHKWWEDWTGTATKKIVKKPSTDNSKLPPMTFGGQGGRAKEIQSIYSQKIKLGSGNPKVSSSNQKSRQPSTVNLNVKPLDATNEAGLEKSAEKKGDLTPMAITTEAFNPWVGTQSDNIPLTQDNRVVGEDEHDYLDDMVPIIERNDLTAEDDEDPNYNRSLKKTQSESTQPMSPSGNFVPEKFSGTTGVDMMGKTTSYLSKGYKNSELVTDPQNQMDLAKANSFRIRRTTGTSNSIRNDPSRKGTPNEKENVVKTANSKRPPTLANSLQKLTGIYSASGRKNSDKFLENNDSMELKEKYNRVPYKYITSVNGEVVEGIEKTLETESAPERIHKSATMNDIDKATGYGKSAMNSRSVGKKPTVQNMTQQKMNASNGNFLTPKLFELNFQGKTDVPKGNNTQGIIYNGQKNPHRTGRTLQMKDAMNYGSYASETTVNLQKYFGLVDKK